MSTVSTGLIYDRYWGTGRSNLRMVCAQLDVHSIITRRENEKVFSYELQWRGKGVKQLCTGCVMTHQDGWTEGRSAPAHDDCLPL